MTQSLEAQRQKRYRENRTKRDQRRQDALQAILAKLEGNDKPLAVELRALAQQGLSD